MSKGNDRDHDAVIQWSDIDKFRFYSIGTAWYSAITIALHPVNVFKTRQQVLSGSELSLSQSSLGGGFGGRMMGMLRGMYRGIGVVLVLAIPARGIYISVLEYGRDYISNILGDMMMKQVRDQDKEGRDERRVNQNFIASVSGGVAGGLAAISSQAITIPMDVISQRQMVMTNALYQEKGDAMSILRNILQTDGIKGLYRGMGISLMSGLPTGTLWWATYSGCQTYMQDKLSSSSTTSSNTSITSMHPGTSSSTSVGDLTTRGIIQLTCGISAATVAATLTQPLDVIRTRFQVSDGTSTQRRAMQQQNTYMTVGKELYKTHGASGFFRGTGLRVMNLALWGTILSSAYEYLRYVSRKEYESTFPLQDFKLTRL